MAWCIRLHAGMLQQQPEGNEYNILGLTPTLILQPCFAATNCARELRRGGGTTVLDAIHVVLAQASHKVCYRAVEALPELMALGGSYRSTGGGREDFCDVELAASGPENVTFLPPKTTGVRVGGQLEDPRAAGALLWPDAAADDPAILSLKRLQASVAPRYKVCREARVARRWEVAVLCIRVVPHLLACRPSSPKPPKQPTHTNPTPSHTNPNPVH